MHFIPFLRLRVDERTELDGIDDSDMGEFAYDYVGLETELSTMLGAQHPGHIGGNREGPEQYVMKERHSSQGSRT